MTDKPIDSQVPLSREQKITKALEKQRAKLAFGGATFVLIHNSSNYTSFGKNQQNLELNVWRTGDFSGDYKVYQITDRDGKRLKKPKPMENLIIPKPLPAGGSRIGEFPA